MGRRKNIYDVRPSKKKYYFKFFDRKLGPLGIVFSDKETADWMAEHIIDKPIKPTDMMLNPAPSPNISTKAEQFLYEQTLYFHDFVRYENMHCDIESHVNKVLTNWTFIYIDNLIITNSEGEDYPINNSMIFYSKKECPYSFHPNMSDTTRYCEPIFEGPLFWQQHNEMDNEIMLLSDKPLFTNDKDNFTYMAQL